MLFIMTTRLPPKEGQQNEGGSLHTSGRHAAVEKNQRALNTVWKAPRSVDPEKRKAQDIVCPLHPCATEAGVGACIPTCWPVHGSLWEEVCSKGCVCFSPWVLGEPLNPRISQVRVVCYLRALGPHLSLC